MVPVLGEEAARVPVRAVVEALVVLVPVTDGAGVGVGVMVEQYPMMVVSKVRSFFFLTMVLWHF